MRDSRQAERPPRRRLWIAADAAAVIALAFAGWLAGPDGRTRAQAFRFLGRFHPAFVHVPIGLILLVPILELAGRRRRAGLGDAARFVLGLAAASAVIVAADGWLLARGGGYSGPLVDGHMWGGIGFSAAAWAAWAARPAGPLRGARAGVYAGLLAAAIGVLFWAGDQGGALTHGRGYLTQEMPARLQHWLGIRPPPAPRPPPRPAGFARTVYGARIVPIFQRSCVSCHGPTKEKGGLRLDSFAGLVDGGDDGPVVEPWLPRDSELVRRITLPPSDDDFMPNNGKNILTPDEVKVIEAWIAAGASDKEPLSALR